MRLRGRRLTLTLAAALVVVVGAGAVAAWMLGHSRDARPIAGLNYRPGPSSDAVVRLSDNARSHPRSAQVQQVVQRYFDAINGRDYSGWTSAVSQMQSAAQAEVDWLRDYASTVDSNLMVLTIADGPLRARLEFTSEQSVELAPKRLPSPCIDWDLTYLLDEQDGRLVLSGIDPSAQSMTACR